MLTTEKFDDFQFEVINVSIPGKPDLHITKNGITFTRRLVEDMGYPQFVIPMLDYSRKIFALKICKVDNEHGMRFSKAKCDQRRAIQHYAGTIKHLLRGIMGNSWKDENRYYITGVWFSEEKAMLFDLNTAKELLPFRVEKASYTESVIEH